MTEAVIIDLLRKSMDWFLYDNGLRHERGKQVIKELKKTGEWWRKRLEAVWQKNVGVGNGVKICDALGDLVSFIEFKKSEKHPWRSDTFRSYFSLAEACNLTN